MNRKTEKEAIDIFNHCMTPAQAVKALAKVFSSIEIDPRKDRFLEESKRKKVTYSHCRICGAPSVIISGIKEKGSGRGITFEIGEEICTRGYCNCGVFMEDTPKIAKTENSLMKRITGSGMPGYRTVTFQR